MPRNWGFAAKMVDRIHKEQSRGLKSTADRYPYAVTGGGHYGASRLVGYDLETNFDVFKEQYQNSQKRKEMVIIPLPSLWSEAALSTFPS